MHILYVLHALPWNEITGSTLVLDNYLRQALHHRHTVSVMVPESAFLNLESSPYQENINLFAFRAQDNWGLSAFDGSMLNEPTVYPCIQNQPDLVHVIDWVNFHPSLFMYLSSLDRPVLRSVCNFEDFCPLTTPVHYKEDSSPCEVPLRREQCIDCVSDNLKVFIPAAEYRYKTVLTDLAVYRENYRTSIAPLLSKRVDFVRQIYEVNFDFVVFPSKRFADYFNKQLLINVKHEIVPHGLYQIANYDLRDLELPIRVIYTGGDRISKGWDIMMEAINILSMKRETKFEIHFFGNTDTLPDDFFNEGRLKLYRHPPYNRQEAYHVLRGFDIAIAPSHFESYGLFVRECVCAGVVPIVIPAFGVSDFIVDGENGIILEEPYADDLAIKLSELTSDLDSLNIFRMKLRDANVPSIFSEFEALESIYKKMTSEQ